MRRLVCDALHIGSEDPTKLTLNVASPPCSGIVDPVAATRSAIGVNCDIRRFGKIKFGMVRQHENTERRV